jgi:hypothetical protein
LSNSHPILWIHSEELTYEVGGERPNFIFADDIISLLDGLEYFRLALIMPWGVPMQHEVNNYSDTPHVCSDCVWCGTSQDFGSHVVRGADPGRHLVSCCVKEL